MTLYPLLLCQLLSSFEKPASWFWPASVTYTAVYLVVHEAGNKKVKTETPVRVPSRCKVLETLILIFCKILKTFKNLIVWVVLNVFQTLENQIYYLEPLHALHGSTKIMKSRLKSLCVEKRSGRKWFWFIISMTLIYYWQKTQNVTMSYKVSLKVSCKYKTFQQEFYWPIQKRTY